jgi:hypothetical protein
MREMEDARALAGLAMEVYSDRISVDQEEQERLRFSPDDIVRLPVHRVVNVWVADGVPRSGFMATTLPMEGLRDDDVAASHEAAQRERGGHYPAPLPDPLVQLPARRTTVRGSWPSHGDRTAAPPDASGNGSRNGRRKDAGQMSFIDVTELEGPDEL